MFVEETFMDLALFIAHTGFANVLNSRKKSDVDSIPVFEYMEDLHHFAGTPCGLILSLDIAWNLIDQKLVGEDTLFYIVEEYRFILYIRDGISKNVFDIISDEDDDQSLGSLQTTFRPDPVSISLDIFIAQNMPVSSMRIYNALCIMFPMFMKQHGLSRNTIVNRRTKMRREIISGKFPSIIPLHDSIDMLA
jgi:hypothetical protein